LHSKRCANTLREKPGCFLALSSGRNKAEGDRLEKIFFGSLPENGPLFLSGCSMA
jgi:hypothetical protein